jgi:small subunit ribosomal protein S20
MANHPSAAKRARQSEKKRVENKYHAKTARNAVRKLRATTEKDQAVEMLPQVSSMLDKLVKKNVIHKNKASNLKLGLQKHVQKL